jgi:two-component system CheB/CheR fusion protein
VVREVEERRAQGMLMVEHAEQVALGLYDAATSALLQASPRYFDLLALAHPEADASAFIGQPWNVASFPPADAPGVFQAVVDRPEPRRFSEVKLRGAGDYESVWDCTLSPIRDAGAGGISFVVVSAVEVTDPVRAREEIEQLDRLKDEFLALASHELRTPLVPLRGYAQMLTRLVTEQEQAPGWDPRVIDYARRFDRQIRYLSRLTDDLFDVGRLQSGKFNLDLQPVDLRTVVAQLVEQCEMLNLEYHCVVEIAVPDAPLWVQGDAPRLVQVGLGLVENAIKYAPASDHIDIRLAQVGDQAQLSVRDYGPGIPAEQHAAIFQRFYQADQPPASARRGLGLGLFIAGQIVAQHGGTITVESAPDQGSTFLIRLPLVPSGA